MSHEIRFNQILLSQEHFNHPFELLYTNEEGLLNKGEVSTCTKVAAITLAVLLAIPTLFIGSFVSIYLISAIHKFCHHYPIENSTIFKTHLLATPLFSQTATHVIENQLNQTVDLREVPIRGIKVGIPNLGNSCWLNSLLKLFAASNLYDSLFRLTDEEIEKIVQKDQNYQEIEKLNEIEKRKKIRNYFKCIINLLRSPQVQENTFLNADHMRVLVDLLTQLNHDFKRKRACDPMELLAQLISYYGYAFPIEKKADFEIGSENFIDDKEAKVPLQLNDNLPGLLSIAPIIDQQDDTIDVNASIHHLFETHTNITFPENYNKLIVQLVRNQYPQLIDNAVKIDEQGHLFIDNRNSLASYEVTHAILHTLELQRAHYVFIEKVGDVYQLHDDSNILQIAPSEALNLLKKSTILQLKELH